MARSGPQFYELCGLIVESDEPFGELPLPPSSPVAPDVRVRWHAPVPARTADAPLAFESRIGEQRLYVHTVAGGTLWCYPDDTQIWVSAETDEIRMRAPSHYVREDVATYILGPVLGFLLRTRGVTVLHASAVQIGEAVVLLAGPAGAGKSTLAAALVARGHQLVSEDVSALERRADGYFVRRGLGFVKLWPDSAAQHGDLPLITPNWSKRYLAAGPTERPAPLRAIVLLGTGEAIAQERLSGREAVVSLVDNAYVPYVLTPHQRRRDLSFFAELASSVVVSSLTRTADFADLERVCDRVEEFAR